LLLRLIQLILLAQLLKREANISGKLRWLLRPRIF
jgi:hypothetical protein